MDNPDDARLNYAYARMQVRKGDIKGAAATLERMLMVNPDQQEIRLFYAAILYRLDNLAEAKAELETLLKAAPQPALRSEAEQYLKLIARRGRTILASGSLSAGFAYDSNRNASPASEERLFMGLPITLTGLNKARGDASLVTAANAELRRPFGPDNRHDAYISGVYYRTDQNNITDVNLRAMSVRAGSRLRFLRNSLTPALIYDHIFLDNAGFLQNAGASLRFERKLAKALSAYAEVKYLDQKYFATPDVGANPQHNGGLQALAAGASRTLSQTMRLDAELSVSAKDADKDYYSTDSVNFSLRHSWLLGRGLFLLSSAQLGRDHYRQPDGMVAPGRKRQDSVMRAGLTLGLPATALVKKACLKDLSLTLGYEHFRDSSNITSYTYNNDKGTLMVNYKWEAGLW